MKRTAAHLNDSLFLIVQYHHFIVYINRRQWMYRLMVGNDRV